jgi:hypothetical protein
MRIPPEYLNAYLVSNAIALALLGLSFRRPNWVRWLSVAIFGWASYTNSRIGLSRPLDYQTFGTLTPFDPYRDFIHGWFREHTATLLLPIAAGQLAIALMLAWNHRVTRRLAVIGAVVFLLAIAPLGVGSAFPFSITYGVGLLVMLHGLDRDVANRLAT